MRLDFYLRIFFTFLFFSFLITFLNFYFNTDTRIDLKESSERKIVFSQLDSKAKYINKSLSLLEIKVEHLLESKKLKEITLKDLKDKNIQSVKYFDLENNLIELKSRPYFFEVNKNDLKNYNLVYLNQNKTIYLIYKRDNELLEISFDMSILFKEIKNIYGVYKIFDEKGNYLFDVESQNDINSFNPNATLKKAFPEFYTSILNNDNYISKKVYSKKIRINGEITYVVVSIPNIQKYEESFLDSIDKQIVYIIFLNIIISFVLSMIFSNPSSRLYKKVNRASSNDEFSKDNSYKELNESLAIIDENVMILKTTINGEITDVSKALCDFTKYTKNELIGHEYTKLLNNDISKDYFEKTWKEIKHQRIKKFEVKGITKNGDDFWLDSLAQPILNEFDEIIGFTFICENITQKKKVEEIYKDLDYQLEQYNSIFEHVSSGICIMNIKGEFLKFNESFMNFFEYTNEELRSIIKFSNIIDEEEIKVELLFEELKDLRKIPNLEKIFVNSLGVKIHLDMTMSILPDNKSIVLIVNSLKDKRKQQEINQLLENKIQEELEKSRQKDEIHKQEQIKNAKLTSIGSLAAGITHEINTPLTYIKGSFELMGYDIEDLPDSEIKTRMLEDKVKIEDGLNRIANIVESMREISQKSKETKEVTNIYSTLITVLTMAYNRSKQVAPIYLKDELFLIGELDKNKYEYYSKVQKQRIEQVWIIIINNALDELIKIDGYENRSLHIEIFNENDEVVIKFVDNAGGIPKDVLPNIFDPFVSTKEHSGMGVGLNVAKNIVDQQEGNIKAFNRHTGAVFEVRLKMHKEEGIN